MFGGWVVAVTAAPPQGDWMPKAPSWPQPIGKVIRASSVKELEQAVRKVQPGDTITIADGHYRLPHYLEIAADNVTLRGESGDRHAVVLDGESRLGEGVGVGDCKGVVIADLTVANIKWNGIKINSDRGAQEVTIHNCVLHNIWQRGIKAPAVPEKKPERSPRDCRVQFCLFYNDRAKAFSDDETDTPRSFNGNYIGGIDVKNTIDWKIVDNVFVGIQGRTREGRGCIYISENGRGCLIERNIFLHCDIGVALGNPSLGYSPLQAIECVARDNFVFDCPETGILACHTRDCLVANNTIIDPEAKKRRSLWVQLANPGLKVNNNLIVGGQLLVTSDSDFDQRENQLFRDWEQARAKAPKNVGQQFLVAVKQRQASGAKAAAQKEEKQLSSVAINASHQPKAVIEAMRKVHAGFTGQAGYVAQFGDSITYSMAFWSAMSWSDPDSYLPDDRLPKKPDNQRWRDYFQGARDKGPKFANYSGWRVGNLQKTVAQVLEREKPAAAIIMIGTNDISGGRLPEGYKTGLQQVVKQCLNAHCIPILNTIPPRRDHEEAVAAANAAIRETAKELSVPLVDYHAACVGLRPDDSWQGTIISQDGVHPSGGKTNIYTVENMQSCGYALRNWVNFLALRQLYFGALTK